MDIDYEAGIDKVIYNDTEIKLNAGGSSWTEDGLNPDLAWAKQVFEETNLEGYPYKMLVLGFTNGEIETIQIPRNSKVLTSDGKTYENTSTSTVLKVEHTWESSGEKDTEYYIGEKLIYIVIFKSTNEQIKDKFPIGYPIYFISNTNFLFDRYNNWSTLKTFDFTEEGCFSLNSSTADFYNAGGLYRLPAFQKVGYEKYAIKYTGLKALTSVEIGYDTSQITDFGSFLSSCVSLRENPVFNTESATSFSGMFSGNYGLKKYNTLYSKNVTTFGSMFTWCVSIREIDFGDTKNATTFGSVCYRCDKLETVKNLDLINATSISEPFYGCSNLTNLDIKNIKISLQIGSGTSTGHLLTLDSLTNIIKECHDNTAGTSTLTLTVGSANLSKLANVYVKLIDITDEMRAEDEYIDNKKPFVVCESTDEGAMLITEYVTSKNWQLA